MNRPTHLVSLVIVALLMSACPKDPEVMDDAGPEGDTGVVDTGFGGPDGTVRDVPGVDAPVADGGADAPPVADGGPGDDGGPDAGPMDAGNDGGPDAGPTHCVPTSGMGLDTELVARNLQQPVFAGAPAGDARLWIVEQPGRIQLLVDGSVLGTPFLDIRSRIRSSGNEQGLLGLAFHPDFATNGRFFVHYSESGSGDSVIAEYGSAVGANVAGDTEQRILVVEQPYGNHNSGMIAFGPDGYLYIGMGDGGSGGDPLDHGEDNTTLLGAMLRIDVDGGDPYGIPADNPYAGSPDGPNDPRREIWAYGLRNPWRFAFDRDNGDLWIGDVGQNAVEEIDYQPVASSGGENYGWNTMEGSRCFEPSSGCDRSGLELPVAEYTHADGCSVTGGYVYRGSCMPDIQGLYFYADFCSNQVWTMDGPAGTPEARSEFLASSISSFGEDGYGELYVISRGGSVYKVVAVP